MKWLVMRPSKSWDCFIAGTPAPQGSKRHVGRGILIEASEKLKPWREAVVKAATARLEETGEIYFDEPVEVWVKFVLSRPKSNKSELPIVPPDLDKLERGIYDALTIAKIWRDDSLIVSAHASKVWSPDGLTGAYVLIESVTSAEKLI
jgi:crossover junction endodeoxyribonuclease RusA